MNLFAFDAAQARAEARDFVERMRKARTRMQQASQAQIGATPKQLVSREGKVALYRYGQPAARARARAGKATRAARQPPPLLIVYALVNRPYMMDLQEDRSLIRGLLAQGLDVYLIDWGYPDRGDRFTGLADYILGYVDRCVAHICAERGVPAIDVLGVCQGGTFSLCYTALRPKRVRRLLTMVTPVDFHTPDNLLSKWARTVDVDLIVETFGNVPGEVLNAAFLALMPFRLMHQKYVDLADLAADPRALENFMRMEKWIFDSPDQAGAAFREFVSAFYQRNALLAGTLEIAGERVRLRALRQPILNVYGLRDHLVPPSASRALAGLTGSGDYQELAFDTGHIGMYVSGRTQRELPARIGEWLRGR